MTDADCTAPRPLTLADLPDVAMPVRLHGALGRAEVGGSWCFGVAVAVAVARAPRS